MTHRSETERLLGLLREHVAESDACPELAEDDYMRSHVAFESASDQQDQILEWLAERLTLEQRSEVTVVSVGAGSGILDVPLMERLAARSQVRYRVIEPIAEQCERLVERFAATDLDGRVELEVHNELLEHTATDGTFDYVLAIHSIYYMPHLRRSLQQLADLRRPGGPLIVGVAPLEEMNRLAQVFWSPQRPHTLWFEEQVEAELVSLGEPFDKTRVEGTLKVDASELAPSSTRSDVVDFLIQAPLDEIPNETRELVTRYLEHVSSTGDGSFGIPHPATLFEVGSGPLSPAARP